MMTSKSNFFKSALAALATVPVAATIFTPAGSAEAFTGGFTFDGAGTNSAISALGATFIPDPGTISISNAEGDFFADTTGSIFSFLVGPTNTPIIDVGALDGTKVLTLINVEAPSIQGLAPNLSDIRYDFTGTFEDGSNANGFVNFSTLLGASAAQTAFGLGQTINASFSGATVAVNNVTVPEPATLLGLGIVAAGMAVSRRRKTIPQ
ncbi:PEP-CTERM sorting domain-containing protein [Nodularia harveyana UHCC-0300]|uniref:PEP-CTERM sorting domain-containing protein n=1 Tax=Nodularia harveyana UHCC-0300 TaxID=2974287 RepID=A0ABU5UGN8_9CYAN|nr:PEP-CTERM sorting domain-containing protein [Nodularia harveyana]MEA5582493.1 PEP-CTERM sorting domain-containing protein [Nodularia harveyana UHCC-0300]